MSDRGSNGDFSTPMRQVRSAARSGQSQIE